MLLRLLKKGLLLLCVAAIQVAGLYVLAAVYASPRPVRLLFALLGMTGFVLFILGVQVVVKPEESDYE